MNTTTPLEGEVLDSMPAAQPAAAASTTLATASNPFLPLVTLAMEKGQVDQLERLFEMQMKWDTDLQRKAFVAAMAAFKAEAGGITIAKSKQVRFTTQKGTTEYMHAELHDITRALVPVMAKHGLSHRWVLEQAGKDIKVTCVMTHRDGHSESVQMTAQADDSGGKNSIQAIASTKTYLERYTLLAATGIATGGEHDDDGRSYGQQAPAERISAEQVQILSDLVDTYIINKDAFFKWIRSGSDMAHVEVLEDVPANRFDTIHDKLAEIRKQKLGESA